MNLQSWTCILLWQHRTGLIVDHPLQKGTCSLFQFATVPTAFCYSLQNAYIIYIVYLAFGGNFLPQRCLLKLRDLKVTKRYHLKIYK